MYQSPLAAVMRHAPSLQFAPDCESKKKEELGLRALAFMDDDVRDAHVLQAGLLMVSWDAGKIEKVEPEVLSTEVALVKETWLRHRPTKFAALRETVKKLNQPALDYVGDSEWTPATGYVSVPYNGFNTVNTFTTATSVNIILPSGQWVNTPDVWQGTSNGIILNTSTANHNSTVIQRYFTATTGTTNIYIPPMWQQHHQSVAWDLELEAQRRQKRLSGPSRDQRKSIRKQLDLLDSVLDDPNDVHVFLRGDALTIQSETTGLKYRFKRAKGSGLEVANLTKGGHFSTPYVLEVFSDDDVYLTKMCVYVKETPALDQLAVMIMYIKAGEESSLIKTANLYSVGDSHRLNAELERLGLLKKKVEVRTRGNQSFTMEAPEQPIVIHEKPALPHPAVAQMSQLVDDYYFLKLFHSN